MIMMRAIGQRNSLENHKTSVSQSETRIESWTFWNLDILEKSKCLQRLLRLFRKVRLIWGIWGLYIILGETEGKTRATLVQLPCIRICSVQTAAWLFFTISRYKKDDIKQLRENPIGFSLKSLLSFIPLERDKMSTMTKCLVEKSSAVSK